MTGTTCLTLRTRRWRNLKVFSNPQAPDDKLVVSSRRIRAWPIASLPMTIAPIAKAPNARGTARIIGTSRLREVFISFLLDGVSLDFFFHGARIKQRLNQKSGIDAKEIHSVSGSPGKGSKPW